MYKEYRLTLMVTHDCNMRCSYCYVGGKSRRSMDERVGRRAIERALASLEPGGTLDLGFFGGEPMLEAALVARLAEYARQTAAKHAARAAFAFTTNGTVVGPATWRVITAPDIDLSVSFDGLPEIHDRHRRFADGRGSSARVLDTIHRLLAEKPKIRTAAVVRPDTVEHLPEAIEFTRDLGIRRIDLNLDVWAEWTEGDADALEDAIARAARVWADGLPHLAVNWFDEKTAALCGLDMRGGVRCGFGDGEVAVAPSGNLYPCERLIGDDDANPMRLAGHATKGTDFLNIREAQEPTTAACAGCSDKALCNTFCRCSNYVRTGDTATPDRLLCLWNQACLRETANVLSGPRAPAAALRA